VFTEEKLRGELAPQMLDMARVIAAEIGGSVGIGGLA
jgi:hypothetical protein